MEIGLQEVSIDMSEKIKLYRGYEKEGYYIGEPTIIAEYTEDGQKYEPVEFTKELVDTVHKYGYDKVKFTGKPLRKVDFMQKTLNLLKPRIKTTIRTDGNFPVLDEALDNDCFFSIIPRIDVASFNSKLKSNLMSFDKKQHYLFQIIFYISHKDDIEVIENWLRGLSLPYKMSVTLHPDGVELDEIENEFKEYSDLFTKYDMRIFKPMR